MKKSSPASNFEKDLDKIKKIVADMEKGGLSLEESLKQFKQGTALIKQCQTTLEEAEQEVEILRNEKGQDTLEPFSNDSDKH